MSIKSKIIVIKEQIDCDKCDSSMNIKNFDIATRILVYECTECSKTIKLSFEEAKVDDNEIEYFALNEKGNITYKCDYCDSYCDFDISEQNEEDKLILAGAYENQCPTCYKKYTLLLDVCDQCHEVIENEPYYRDEKNIEICSKECYEEYFNNNKHRNTTCEEVELDLYELPEVDEDNLTFDFFDVDITEEECAKLAGEIPEFLYKRRK